MKNWIVFLFSFLFLLTGCDNESPVDFPEEEEKEKNDMDRTFNEWNPDLLFKEENAEAKNKLVGLWYMLYDGWGEQPDKKDKNDYDPIRMVEFLPNGDYWIWTNYPDEYVQYQTYEISDTFFYFYSLQYNEEDGIDRGDGVWIYNYEFYDDKFRAKIAWGILASDGWEYIFKRVEEEINK